MYTKWTEHLSSEQDKQKFQNSILGSRDVLDRLKDILDAQERDLLNSEVSLDTYSQPNWAERQAHKNGYRSCLRSLRKLIDLDQQIIPKEIR